MSPTSDHGMRFPAPGFAQESMWSSGANARMRLEALGRSRRRLMAEPGYAREQSKSVKSVGYHSRFIRTQIPLLQAKAQTDPAAWVPDEPCSVAFPGWLSGLRRYSRAVNAGIRPRKVENRSSSLDWGEFPMAGAGYVLRFARVRLGDMQGRPEHLACDCALLVAMTLSSVLSALFRAGLDGQKKWQISVKIQSDDGTHRRRVTSEGGRESIMSPRAR